MVLFLLFLSYFVVVLFFVSLPMQACASYTNFNANDLPICGPYRWAVLGYIVSIAVMTVVIFYSGFFVEKRAPASYLSEEERKGVLVFIPCYSESRDALKNTVDSVVESDYPNHAKIICVVVDGKVTGAGNDQPTSNYAKEIFSVGAPTYADNGHEVYAGLYRETQYVLFLKKQNKGKKDSLLVIQKLWAAAAAINNTAKPLKDGNTFVIDMETNKYQAIGKAIPCLIHEDLEYFLLLDTDTIVQKDGVTTLADYLDHYDDCAAVCGETTITNINNLIFVTWAQYFEYWITHKTLKALESVFGQVLVVSGCYAMYRRSVLSDVNIIHEYQKESMDNLLLANVSKLGEDRYLTNLILMHYPEMNTKYIDYSKCYTECPEKIHTLFCQRRRWTNSLIFCHFLLLLNCPNYPFWQRVKFIFILIWELWNVFMMPLLMAIAYVWIGLFIYNSYTTQTLDLMVLCLTVFCLIIPIFQCFIFNRIDMIPTSIIFIVFTPMFSILIPFYSFYYVDDVKWGITRATKEDTSKEAEVAVAATIANHQRIPQIPNDPLAVPMVKSLGSLQVIDEQQIDGSLTTSGIFDSQFCLSDDEESIPSVQHSQVCPIDTEVLKSSFLPSQQKEVPSVSYAKPGRIRRNHPVSLLANSGASVAA